MTQTTSTSVKRDPVRPVQETGGDERPWAQENSATLLLVGFMLMVAVSMFVTMAIIDRRGYSVLPWGDMWDYWIARSQTSFLKILFAQHNEHRIAVARLFFLIDEKIFQGKAIFLFVCIFLFQTFHALVLWRLAVARTFSRKAVAVFLGTAAVICLFSAQQYSNFTWAFQIAFVTVFLAITCAFTSLMIAARMRLPDFDRQTRRRNSWLLASILFGVAATYSLANGLLVWLLLVSEAYWLRMRRHEQAILTFIGTLFVLLYFVGYKTPPQHSSIRNGLLNLPDTFAYAVCMMGSPLDASLSAINRIFSIGNENWRLAICSAGGTVALITAALLWGYFLSKCRSASAADVVMLHVLLFNVATAFLIGIGRHNFPLREAVTSRYLTPALLFWFCILFLIFSVADRELSSGSGRLLRLFEFATCVPLLLGIVLFQPPQIQYAHGAAQYVSEVEAALSAPVYDRDLWGRIYYNPAGMVPAVKYLQTGHLSVFVLPRLRWLGDPLTMHYKPAPADRCAGYMDSLDVLKESALPGLRLRGWAWDKQLKKIATAIVFTDSAGNIIGFGYTGFDRADVRTALPEIGFAGVGWVGYVSGLNHESVAVHMATDGGRATCLIGVRRVVDFPEVGFDQLGSPLNNVPIRIDGQWTVGGLYPTAERPPVPTRIIGSWVHGDADTGTLRLGPFHTGNSDVIALPILTGANTRGLSVEVVNTTSGTPIATLAPPAVLMKWRAWKISLPQHDMRLEIVAKDQGADWGQWMALGMPYSLK